MFGESPIFGSICIDKTEIVPFLQIEFIQNGSVFQGSHAGIYDVSTGNCMMPLTGYLC